MGRRVRIRIHCRRGSDLVVLLSLALLTVVTLGALFLSDRRADASPSGEPQQLAVSPRRYYLTSSQIDADDALTACATGYHTASLWEILDTTNLRYDSTLGLMLGDSGSGPPNTYPGWVRTGGGLAVPRRPDRAIAMPGPAPTPVTTARSCNCQTTGPRLPG